jgi:hypothetical protein
MVVAEATEKYKWILVYGKAYFIGVRWLIYYITVNVS